MLCEGLILSEQGDQRSHTFKTRGTKDSYFKRVGTKDSCIQNGGSAESLKKQRRGGLNLSWLDMRSRPSRSRSSSKRSRFPKHPSPIDPLTHTWFLSQACRLVGKVTNTRHPSRRGGDCHNGILSENLASRHFFQNQLTLNIVALLYNCYGMCKCILFTGYPPVL